MWTSLHKDTFLNQSCSIIDTCTVVIIRIGFDLITRIYKWCISLYRFLLVSCHVSKRHSHPYRSINRQDHHKWVIDYLIYNYMNYDKFRAFWASVFYVYQFPATDVRSCINLSKSLEVPIWVIIYMLSYNEILSKANGWLRYIKLYKKCMKFLCKN